MQKEVTRLLKSNNILLEIKYFLMRLLILLFILISLNGCATGRYDKAVVTKIESSSYRIAFKALNDSMSKLENYIMVKGAEICLNNGFNYFSIHNRENRVVIDGNIGRIMRSEAEVKLYNLKPNSIAGVYNCLEVITNLGSTIDGKDLSNKFLKNKPKDKQEKKDTPL